MKKIALMLVAGIAAGAIAACQPGSGEKAGENADSAYEENTQGQKNLTDGPMENAGEAVDAARDNAGDAASDAQRDVEKALENNKEEAPK